MNVLDYESYKKIWETIIEPEIKQYLNEYTSILYMEKNAQYDIWDKYKELNMHCKSTYMRNPNGKLDRHKVAACYIVAICSVSPIKIDPSVKKEISPDVFFVPNEQLAITTGLSILRAFILLAIQNNDQLSEQQKIKAAENIAEGIKIPDDTKVHHGEYLKNFAMELYFTRKENSMNVLSLANELYLLELYSLYADTSNM